MFFLSAAVVGEEEVEEVLVAVGDNGKVAMATGKEAVLGAAIYGVAGLENESHVLDGFAVVIRDGGSDAGGGEVIAFAKSAGFVVIPEKERAVLIAPDGFEPDGFVLGGVEIDAFGVGEFELIGTLAAGGDAGGMEDVEFAIGPHGGGVAVDDFGQRDVGGGLDVGVLGVGGDYEERDQEYTKSIH